MAEGVGLTMVQLHGDEGPAFCAEVARRTGAKRHQGARASAARADVAALEPFHTDFHLVDAYRARRATAGRGRRSTGSSSAAAASPVPLILSGGLTPENVGDAIAAVRPFAVDVASGTEARARRQGPEPACEAFAAAVRAAGDRPGRGGRVMAVAGVEHRFGPYGGQYVPETLMPALAELEEAWLAARRRPGLRRGAAPPAARLRRPPDAAVPRRAPLRGRRPRGLAQARGPHAHGRRTSSTTRSARRCWPSAWASGGSSPRPARASTASASATACALLGLECVVYMGAEDIAPAAPERRADGAARRRASCPSRRGRGRSRRPPPRRSATGSRTSPRRTTSSARRSARPRTRRSSATSSA